MIKILGNNILTIILFSIGLGVLSGIMWKAIVVVFEMF
jgi:hypothetical protein